MLNTNAGFVRSLPASGLPYPNLVAMGVNQAGCIALLWPRGDTNRTVSVLGPTGSVIKEWGLADSVYPVTSIALDELGNTYVRSQGYPSDAVYKFDASGALVGTWTISYASYTSVDVDAANNLYIGITYAPGHGGGVDKIAPDGSTVLSQNWAPRLAYPSYPSSFSGLVRVSPNGDLFVYAIQSTITTEIQSRMDIYSQAAGAFSVWVDRTSLGNQEYPTSVSLHEAGQAPVSYPVMVDNHSSLP